MICLTRRNRKKNKTRVNKESAQVFISALFGTMCVCIWRCPNCMWARCYVAHPHASLDVSVWKYFTATIWRLHRVRWRENVEYCSRLQTNSNQSTLAIGALFLPFVVCVKCCVFSPRIQMLNYYVGYFQSSAFMYLCIFFFLNTTVILCFHDYNF